MTHDGSWLLRRTAERGLGGSRRWLESWEATYLGTQIAIIAASDQAYELLSAHGLVSWQSGGCAILTEALVQLLGASPYGLVQSAEGSALLATVQSHPDPLRPGEVVDHVVAEFDGFFFDADGAYTQLDMILKHRGLEGRRTRLRKLASAAEVEGIECPAELVEELVGLLREELP